MRILNTPSFNRELKNLAKRHKSLLDDITILARDLVKKPHSGIYLFSKMPPQYSPCFW